MSIHRYKFLFYATMHTKCSYMYLFQIKQFIFFSGKFLYLTFKNLLTNKLTNISIQQKINLQEVEKQSYWSQSASSVALLQANCHKLSHKIDNCLSSFPRKFQRYKNTVRLFRELLYISFFQSLAAASFLIQGYLQI